MIIVPKELEVDEWQAFSDQWFEIGLLVNGLHYRQQLGAQLRGARYLRPREG